MGAPLGSDKQHIDASMNLYSYNSVSSHIYILYIKQIPEMVSRGLISNCYVFDFEPTVYCVVIPFGAFFYKRPLTAYRKE